MLKVRSNETHRKFTNIYPKLSWIDQHMTKKVKNVDMSLQLSDRGLEDIKPWRHSNRFRKGIISQDNSREKKGYLKYCRSL